MKFRIGSDGREFHSFIGIAIEIAVGSLLLASCSVTFFPFLLVKNIASLYVESASCFFLKRAREEFVFLLSSGII